MAAAERDLDLDAAVFLDDLMSFVCEHHGISSVRLIPPAQQNVYREVPNYEFLPVIGEGLLHALRELSITGQNIVEFSNICSLPAPNPRSGVANFIRYHRASALTDEDFIKYPAIWCCRLFRFLVLVSSLCIHFEHHDRLHVIYIKDAAAAVLRPLIGTLTLLKMNKLARYAERVPNRLPYSQTCLYITE